MFDWMKRGSFEFYAAAIIVAVFSSIISFSALNDGAYAQEDKQQSQQAPKPYKIISFKNTSNIDGSGAVDTFDNRINEWLAKHPNIDIVGYADTITRSPDNGANRETRIISILYREK